MRAIEEKAAEDGRVLVTLDGPCATGKTTLAGRLAAALRGEVLHTDDFVIPHRMKTPERLAIPGGNCDAERLIREVAEPFRKGLPVRYRRYDFRRDELMPEEQLPETRILILEGSYCNLPGLRERAGVHLFLQADRETREARLRERESPESLRRFHELWIPLEDAYFEAYRLPREGDLILDGGEADSGFAD